MRRSSRFLSTLSAPLLAAFAVIASAEEASSPPLATSAELASASPPLPATPPVEPSSQSSRFVNARVGAGRAGTTRIVLEVSQSVEFLAVELADRPGVELRLIGTNATATPPPIEIGDGRVRRVAFSSGTNDLVARIEGEGPRLKSRAFALQDPARVVIDLELADPPAPSLPPTKSNPPKSTVSPLPAAPAKKGASMSAPSPGSDEPASGKLDSTSVASATASDDEPRFDDFLKWVDEFREHVEAIGPATPEEEKVRHWRRLASLFQRRGLMDEAERTLTRALKSPAQDTTHAFVDSLRLAEIRLEIGRPKDALIVAQKLSPFGRSNDEKLRLARVHADGGSPIAARAILEEVLPRVSSGKKPAAVFLLARCQWDAGSPEKALLALDSLDAIDSRDDAAERIGENATVLRADCLFALGRLADARAQYERATRFELGPEEAAWTRLQLGNLAHREGRFEDAKNLYREAATGWPDTFYATQAAWFLQATERLDAVGQKREQASRG